MRTIIKIFLLLIIPVFCNAQTNTIDSLKQLLQNEKEDTSRVLLLNLLSRAYLGPSPDTSLMLGQKALLLAKKTGFIKGEAISLNRIANTFQRTGNYPKALELHIEALKKAEAIGDKRSIAVTFANLSADYAYQGDSRQAVNYNLKALAIDESINEQRLVLLNYANLGDNYEKLNMLDSAEFYTKRAYDLAVQSQNADLTNIALNNLGNIYSKMGQDAVAMSKYKMSIPYFLQQQDDEALCESYLGMAKLFQKAGNTDSSLYYAKLSLASGKKGGLTSRIMDASIFLTGYYTAIHNVDSAFVYQSAAIAAKDSLFSQEKLREIQSLGLDEAMRHQQIEDAKKEAQTQLKFNALFGGIATLLIVAFILYGNNRRRKKDNVLLKKQKEEIDSKAHELLLQKENLQRSYYNVEQLGEIGRKITSSLSVEKIIGTVYDNVNALMDASVFGIGIYNDALKRIEFPATYEDGRALPFYYNSVEDPNRFAAICFKERKEIIMGNLDNDYRFYVQEVLTPDEGKQPVSLIYLPLVVKEKILGVITVQSFQRDAYSDYHLFMLRNISIYTAIALENAESFETLSETVVRLKSTQSQLIQSEKMASLGELTAGIAHEIQNPLNFVNNFSEVNTELIEEMKTELNAGNKEDAIAIANAIADNEQKINHHGKRADAIVKGMLQHSRSSSGIKEPTNINSLADEYLRLAYHGLRAKDKSFNATLKTDYDESIGNVNIVPQEIGRVILNLITNAFYAVTEKKRQQKDNYEPTVSVSTKNVGDKVLIAVKDNGNGISAKVLDKIFQPFFTTKASGQGTGLGLSLSYDIMKAHGGELKAETKEGEFAEFIIQLPV